MPQLLVSPESNARPLGPSSTRPLVVVEHIRRMRGGAQSHLMRCSGDDYYVVKFQGNPQGTRILVNELLGTRLAARLGLATTPAAICYVREDLVRLTHDLYFELAKAHVPCQPGLHFGSRYVLNPRRATINDFIPDEMLSMVRNLSDFAGMLVFDKWTCNTDGRQTIFYQIDDHGSYKTVMVDQGFCFNATEWTFPDAPLRGLYARHSVYKHVRGMDDFEPWIERLESQIVNAMVLDEIAKTVPPEWYESDWGSLQRLLERLDRRRRKVRDLLWDTWRAKPEVFPSWNCKVAVVSAASA